MYEERIVKPEMYDDNRFFKELTMTIQDAIQNIRNDIIRLFGRDDISLKVVPRHPDWKIHKKILRLVEMRKQNLITVEKLKALAKEPEFIICECGAKMYKKPVGVPFIKCGNNYVVKDTVHASHIKYIYSCERCNLAVDEEVYLQTKQNRERRRRLLEQGYNYVPNDFGIWHFIDDGNPPKKPPELDDSDRKRWIRVIEKVHIKGYRSPFLKVYDKCLDTGEIVYIIN